LQLWRRKHDAIDRGASLKPGQYALSVKLGGWGFQPGSCFPQSPRA
jgi:hypothetical protein